MARACIGIGSSLGEREEAVKRALSLLNMYREISVIACSQVYETEPEGGIASRRFLNAAALVDTTLEAAVLLEALLAIERHIGRDRRSEVRWGDRVIDLDLLLYDELITTSPTLTIPHPRMHQRSFVLRPLREIAPEIIHPQLHKTIAQLWFELSEK
ncbi:MAG: 2-amino-4-hydroxy-6-hydroxymethyldihydropteridine diphosphokinase [Candidatus Omnitrophica bacterium]|nr:2-amino-4-hydroxy-6-hydroxymethyldihydropteridine diphosphokinase [Candidatus Omnitrophota bacterium]